MSRLKKFASRFKGKEPTTAGEAVHPRFNAVSVAQPIREMFRQIKRAPMGSTPEQTDKALRMHLDQVPDNLFPDAARAAGVSIRAMGRGRAIEEIVGTMTRFHEMEQAKLKTK